MTENPFVFYGAISSIAIDFKIPIITTLDSFHTAKLLVAMCSKKEQSKGPFIKKIRNGMIKDTIVIVGNPRSRTTFLHRYLVNHSFGSGTKLYQMLYSSVILQKIIKPFLPLLEKVSPTKHHSTEAHKTSLSSVETDDV